MIPAAIVLIVLGLALALVAGPFAFAPILLGVILLVLYFLGVGKRAAAGDEPSREGDA